jgi:enamine deaminase RidA (YjgF/YER057c/UK114 family)
MATDWKVGLDASSRQPEDFPFNEYSIQLQTRAIFRQIDDLCKAAGTDIENMVRIDQFGTDWDAFRHYFPVRNEYLVADRPASTAIAIQGLLIPEAALIIDGIAVVPRGDLVKEAINNPSAPTPRAGYSMAVRFGDWVWCAGASPTDFISRAAYPGGAGHAQPDGIWVDPNFAYDSAIENQTRYNLHKLELYLDAAESDLEHVLKAQVYLTDSRDLPGLMRVWKETWGDAPPATTVVPIDRMLIGGSRCEINVIAMTKSSHLTRTIVETENAPKLPFGLPQAVKAGHYVFLSGGMAIDERGVDQRARRMGSVSPYLVSQGRDELRVILANAEAICGAAGCTISDVVRVQLFATDLGEVGAALGPWNDTFNVDAPTLSVVGVSGPHPVPDLALVADIVAYASPASDGP